MSADRSSAEFLAAGEKRVSEINAEVDEVLAVQREHPKVKAALVAQHQAALDQLVTNLLPALTPDACSRAVRLTAFVALQQIDPLAEIEIDRKALQQRIAEIEAEQRYQNRELLITPRTGELMLKIAELEEFLAPLSGCIALCNNHPRFAQLLQGGYGTDQYKTAFWRMSYYLDWKAADEIVEKFPNRRTFAEVCTEYRAAKEAVATYELVLGQLRQSVGEIKGLIAEMAGASEMLGNISERHLALWRARLGKHLMGMDPAWIADRLQGEKDVEVLYKLASGLGTKIDYLDAVMNGEVKRHLDDLIKERAELWKDFRKASRNRLSPANYSGFKFDKRFRDRPTRQRKLWQRTRKTYVTVCEFDAFHRARLVDDFLWWDLMTDGRWDGACVPTVARWREDHPGYRYDPGASWIRDDDSDAGAAAAVIAADQALGGPDDGDNFTALDPS